MFVKVLNWFFKRFSRTRLWLWLSKTVITNLTFRIWGHPTFPMADYEEKILPILEESDSREQKYIYAFVSGDTKSFTRLLIKAISGSYFAHTGFIYPDHKHIVHMLGRGITEEHILNLLADIDIFAIVRFPVTGSEYVEFERRLQKYIRIKAVYDFQQELDDDGVHKYSCSELVWRCSRGLIDNENFKPRIELGRLLFEPDDVYKNGEVIYERKI